MFVVTAYLFMNYASEDVIGYYPYFNLRWDSWWTVFELARWYFVLSCFHWGIGLLTNLLKGGYTVPNPLSTVIKY